MVVGSMVEAAEALEDRGAGPAVERDALLDLRVARLVADEHDVGLRMAGAQHRRAAAALAGFAGAHLLLDLAQLADRTLEVLLLISSSAMRTGWVSPPPRARLPDAGRVAARMPRCVPSDEQGSGCARRHAGGSLLTNLA